MGDSLDDLDFVGSGEIAERMLAQNERPKCRSRKKEDMFCHKTQCGYNRLGLCTSPSSSSPNACASRMLNYIDRMDALALAVTQAGGPQAGTHYDIAAQILMDRAQTIKGLRKENDNE